MKIQKIETDEQLAAAIARVDEVWNSVDVSEIYELNELVSLIENYEEKYIK
ncbi:hypothetical protein [Colwellia sp. PAMC 20917]|jgi:hypothetical protein|uniref:hypothetical protein n=1 Tax=Colwellia sp. PAMC 20917 TaxID=1816218 RepID=UPI0012F846AE|nr:hypothetical protein [Colwellia sp. PAMC 20917]